MDKKTELKGLIKEAVLESMPNDKIVEIEKKASEMEEKQAKLFEENTELKAKLDDMQGKIVTVKQNTGVKQYRMKGYNPDMTKNFKLVATEEQQKEVADWMVKALTIGNTGAYAVPTEYGSQLLGLAELNSIALQKCRVIPCNTNIVKMPSKATRATTDVQAFGTANAAASTTLGQLTFTIDKRIGGYELVYNDVLMDSNFDIVSEFVEPMIAEAIGQDIDDMTFNGTGSEFTSDIADLTAALTVASGGNLTFANLNTMFHGIEWERGLVGEWYINRAKMGDISGLVGSSNDHPIFKQESLNGRPMGTLMGAPVNYVPVLSSSYSSGAVLACFADLRQYILMLREGLNFTVNPWAQGKEGITEIYGYTRGDGNYVNSGAFSVAKWA